MALRHPGAITPPPRSGRSLRPVRDEQAEDSIPARVSITLLRSVPHAICQAAEGIAVFLNMPGAAVSFAQSLAIRYGPRQLVG